MESVDTELELGADVGGTFTDLVLRSSDGWERVCKTPSTPDEPASAVLAGMDRLLAQMQVAPGRLTFWVHGTTTATNALLQRTAARVGLLTTRGFGDLLEIRRQQRPSLYDLFADKPEALVPPEARMEVRERIAADGRVITELDRAELTAALERLRDLAVEAVAICFLHSHINPGHEAAAAQAARQQLPGVYVCASSEVLAEFREYERLSTTVVNACLGPVVDRYLDDLGDRLRARGLTCTPHVLQSNGRLMTFAAARRSPMRLVASGPSAGVIGAAHVGEQVGCNRLLTLDVGGTSADVAAVVDGRPRMTSLRQVAGCPLKAPTVEVLSIGAGGGSIAWVDPGGFLRVGPHSAGAVPGPACYDRGGAEPTVTDAHLLLGRLNPSGLVSGDVPLNPAAAEAALTALGAPLQLSPPQAAQSVIRLVNAQMARALRGVTTVRGDDPRSFAIMAYGGAGPLHALDLARALGISRVIIPRRPGSFCACGALAMDVGMDFGHTLRMALEPANAPRLQQAFEMLEQQADAWLHGERVPPRNRQFHRTLEARYVGQDYELAVPVRPHPEGIQEAVEAFHAAHHKEYGYARRDCDVECVTLRVYAHAASPRPDPPDPPAVERGAKAAPTATRSVWWEGAGAIDTPVYERGRLPAGWSETGPLVVEQLDTTTLVPPGAVVRADDHANLVMDVQ